MSGTGGVVTPRRPIVSLRALQVSVLFAIPGAPTESSIAQSAPASRLDQGVIGVIQVSLELLDTNHVDKTVGEMVSTRDYPVRTRPFTVPRDSRANGAMFSYLGTLVLTRGQGAALHLWGCCPASH